MRIGSLEIFAAMNIRDLAKSFRTIRFRQFFFFRTLNGSAHTIAELSFLSMIWIMNSWIVFQTSYSSRSYDVVWTGFTIFWFVLLQGTFVKTTESFER